MKLFFFLVLFVPRDLVFLTSKYTSEYFWSTFSVSFYVAAWLGSTPKQTSGRVTALRLVSEEDHDGGWTREWAMWIPFPCQFFAAVAIII
jgi:hypothetical protein